MEKDPSEAFPLVRKLLDEGAAVDEVFPDKMLTTPLHQAAKNQNCELVELLLNNGASINAPNDFGITPLMLAVLHGQVEICNVLLRRGADASLRDFAGESILALAVINRHPAIVKLLLEYGFDINIRDGTGQTALIRAIMIDHAEANPIRGVEMRPDVNSFSTTKLEMMRLLIDNGIGIESRSVDGATAMHTAALEGDIEAFKLLIDAGANPNVVDHCNRKPLWFSVRQNHVEIVKLLLERTTNINDQVYNGHTCLSTATRWGLEECVKLLLGAGAEIWSSGPGPQFLEPERRLLWYGCDALSWAVSSHDQDVVRLILVAGAERQFERTTEGGYAEWLEVWDRAQPVELDIFIEWINRRQALSDTPEHEALRTEMSEKVYGLEEEKRRKIAEEIVVSYSKEEGERRQQR